MTKSTKFPLKTNLSAADTADHLARELGGDTAHWAIWLANERKPNRVTRRLAPEPGPGRPRYNADKVDQYITLLRSAPSKAAQSGSRPGAATDRKFAPHVSPMKRSEGADPAAVLFVIPKPLATFILSPDEARHLAARLTSAADEVDSEGDEAGR